MVILIINGIFKWYGVCASLNLITQVAKTSLYFCEKCTKYIYIVNEGKNAHFLLNFTLNKIKLAQIMNNRVYFVRNTCYFDVQ